MSVECFELIKLATQCGLEFAEWLRIQSGHTPLTSLSISGSTAQSSKREMPAGISNCSEVRDTLAQQQGIVVWNWRIGVVPAVIASSKLRYQSSARSYPRRA